MTHRGYVRRLPQKSPPRSGRSLPDITPNLGLQEGEDFTRSSHRVNSQQELLVISRSAKAYTVKMSEIPVQRRQAKGIPLITLLPEEMQGDPDQIFWTMPLPEDCLHQGLITLTRTAKIKRLPLDDFTHLTQRGLSLMKLKEADELLWMGLEKGEFFVVATSSGRALRFALDDEQLPMQGRNTQGQTVLRLRTREQLVGAAVGGVKDTIVFVSENGYAKRSSLAQLPLGCRGDLGNTAFHFSLKNDQLIAIQGVAPKDELVLMTDRNRMARISVNDLPLHSKTEGTQKPIVTLLQDEKIIQTIVYSPIP